MFATANLPVLPQTLIQQPKGELRQINRDHPHVQTSSYDVEEIIITTTGSITGQISQPRAVEHNDERQRAHEFLQLRRQRMQISQHL
jgi:hypothetical protein